MLQKIGRLSVLWNIYRQKLKEDLSRYGIQAVIVDEYNQMTEILKTIECSVKKNVFISGSANRYDGIWNQALAEVLSVRPLLTALFVKSMGANISI